MVIVDSTRAGRYVRFFTLVVCCSLLFLPLGVTMLHSTYAAQRNCQDPLPPQPSETATTTVPTDLPGTIFINEFLTNPTFQWNCADSTSGEENIWIELYSSRDQPVNLYELHTLLEVRSGMTGLRLPFGSTIPAHGFLTIFPFYHSDQPLGAITELRLVTPDTTIDEVTIPTQPLAPDTSYARIPDGSSHWEVTNTPTINASNVPVYTTEASQKSSTAEKRTSTSQASSSHTSSKNTPTPKETKTPSTKKSSGTKEATSPIASTNGTEIRSSDEGKQPTWSALNFPGAASATEDSSDTTQRASPLTPSESPPPSQQRDNPLGKVFLTLLVIAGTFASWWGRRFLRR